MEECRDLRVWGFSVVKALGLLASLRHMVSGIRVEVRENATYERWPSISSPTTFREESRYMPKTLSYKMQCLPNEARHPHYDEYPLCSTRIRRMFIVRVVVGFLFERGD